MKWSARSIWTSGVLMLAACGGKAHTATTGPGGGGGAGTGATAKIAATAGAPLTLASTSDPSSLVVDDMYVWWIASGDSIVRMAKNGAGMAETVVRVPPDVSATGLAAGGGTIYWTTTDGTIHAKHGVGAEKVVVAGEALPGRLWLHDGTLTWIATDGQLLRSAPADGSGAAATLLTEVKADTPLAFDGGAIYGVDFDAGTVWRLDAGKQERAVLAEKQYGPVALALGPEGTIYWANSGAAPAEVAGGGADVSVASEAGSIVRAPRDGHAGAISVLEHLDDPIALSIDGELVTFVSFGKLLRAPRDGSAEPAVIVEGERIRGYAADASGVYWTTEDGVVHALHAR